MILISSQSQDKPTSTSTDMKMTLQTTTHHKPTPPTDTQQQPSGVSYDEHLLSTNRYNSISNNKQNLNNAINNKSTLQKCNTKATANSNFPCPKSNFPTLKYQFSANKSYSEIEISHTKTNKLRDIPTCFCMIVFSCKSFLSFCPPPLCKSGLS